MKLSLSVIVTVCICLSSLYAQDQDEWYKFSLTSKYIRLLDDKPPTDFTVMAEMSFLPRNDRFSLISQLGLAMEDTALGSNVPDPTQTVIYGSLGARWYSSSYGMGWWIGLFPIYRNNIYSSSKWLHLPEHWIYTWGVDGGYSFILYRGLGISCFTSVTFAENQLEPGTLAFMPDIGLLITYTNIKKKPVIRYLALCSTNSDWK